MEQDFGGDFESIQSFDYHKLVIMTDADVDGGQYSDTIINALLPIQCVQLLRQDLFILRSLPLYQVKQGKKMVYLDSEEELDDLLKEWLLLPKLSFQTL